MVHKWRYNIRKLTPTNNYICPSKMEAVLRRKVMWIVVSRKERVPTDDEDPAWERLTRK